ncbi:hypothetical protein [Candidatus Frankia alpina]|uniref:hypothetical protein n=1 Tax=Candidatus Frankia alpina TaxID=2699483 RepID=UPI0013D0A7E1|nr:hypothetical protein [Candidatus Frankia alpina]
MTHTAPTPKDPSGHPRTGIPAPVDWERTSLDTADQIEQVFPAMTTVTVDGTDIEICEDWADDELTFTELLLAGHHDRPTALAAARTYLDAHTNDLIDETRSWAHPHVRHGHIRLFLHHGLDSDEAWTWVAHPISRDIPVTAVTAPV